MMNSRKNDPKSLMMLISAMLIFGSIGVFRRYLPLSSALIAFSRGLLGGLFVLCCRKLSGKGRGEALPRRTFLKLVFTGAVMGINWILLFEAYNHTTVAIATLCYYMQPTIVILLSPVLFREKLSAVKAVCAAVAIAGMFLVSGAADGNNLQTGNLQGVFLGLGAAVFYSVVVMMNKSIRGIDAYQKTTVQLLSAGLIMVPYMLLTDGGFSGSFSTTAVLLLLVIGIIHTGVAYLLYFGCMDGLNVQTVAILSYIDPVSALLFSAVFLREPLNLPGMIGAVMIIGSAVISETLAGKER